MKGKERRPEKGICFISLSPWSSREQDTPESLCLHGVTFQNTAMLILTVVRIRVHCVCRWTVLTWPNKQQQIMGTSRCSYVHLLYSGIFFFRQPYRSTRIPLSYDCHSSSHFQPMYYMPLGRKRTETRSDGDMLQNVITNSQAVTAFLEISAMPLPHAKFANTAAYTKVGRWCLEKEYSEDWSFD